MQKIKKDDEVIVLVGRSKGHVGKVKDIHENERVVVESANIVKKNVKPNPQRGVEGGIVEKEAAIHISNVAIYNPQTKKSDKVKFKLLDDGKKVRVFKSTGEFIDIK